MEIEYGITTLVSGTVYIETTLVSGVVADVAGIGTGNIVDADDIFGAVTTLGCVDRGRIFV